MTERNKPGPVPRPLTDKQRFEASRLTSLGVNKKTISEELDMTYLMINRALNERIPTVTTDIDNCPEDLLRSIIIRLIDHNCVPYDTLLTINNAQNNN